MCAAKAKSSTQVYAVLGSDEAEVKRVAKELSEKLSPPGGGDFGNDLIDGTASNADDAATRVRQTVEALLTFPFFGGEKLVWLKNANFLADNVLGRSAAVQEALESLQETLQAGLPNGITFLLSASECDKRRTFYKSFVKLAAVQTFDRIDASKAGWEEDALELARQLAAPLDLHFEDDALNLLAVRTGGDRRTLLSELEKLSLYMEGENRGIREDDVRFLVPMTASTVIFELGNSLASRSTSRSLELLEQLLTQEESAVAIIQVAIIPTIRNLLAVKDLMVRHKLNRPAQPFFFGKSLEKLPPEALEHLPRKKDGGINSFALGIAAQHAHRYSIQELRAAQKATLSTNIALVTSGGDPGGLLKQLIVRITATAS